MHSTPGIQLAENINTVKKILGVHPMDHTNKYHRAVTCAADSKDELTVFISNQLITQH